MMFYSFVFLTYFHTLNFDFILMSLFKIHQNIILPLFLVVITILTLSHSAFIFYAPFFLILFILIKKNRNLEISATEIFIISLSFFLLVFLIYISNGSEIHIEKICASVKEFVSKNCGLTDQISWLNSSIDNYINAKCRNLFII